GPGTTATAPARSTSTSCSSWWSAPTRPSSRSPGGTRRPPTWASSTWTGCRSCRPGAPPSSSCGSCAATTTTPPCPPTSTDPRHTAYPTTRAAEVTVSLRTSLSLNPWETSLDDGRHHPRNRAAAGHPRIVPRPVRPLPPLDLPLPPPDLPLSPPDLPLPQPLPRPVLPPD